MRYTCEPRRKRKAFWKTASQNNYKRERSQDTKKVKNNKQIYTVSVERR